MQARFELRLEADLKAQFFALATAQGREPSGCSGN